MRLTNTLLATVALALGMSPAFSQDLSDRNDGLTKRVASTNIQAIDGSVSLNGFRVFNVARFIEHGDEDRADPDDGLPLYVMEPGMSAKSCEDITTTLLATGLTNWRFEDRPNTDVDLVEVVDPNNPMETIIVRVETSGPSEPWCG